MRDRDIRIRLTNALAAEHASDPSTLILDELGICGGAARVDIALVNSCLVGYEIKSDSDTLERLPHQLAVYEKVLDSLAIVAGCKHAETLAQRVPGWVGLVVASAGGRGAEFVTVRSPGSNPNVDAFGVAQLLWRNEALALLEQHGLDVGVRTKSRGKMWERIAEELSLDDVRDAVRACLRSRTSWRPADRPAPGDVRSRPCAT